MWKEKNKKNIAVIAVRTYNGRVFGDVPQVVLAHLGVNSNSQLVFKLRPNKTVSLKILNRKSEKLLSFKPAKRRKSFPALTAFLSQR